MARRSPRPARRADPPPPAPAVAPPSLPRAGAPVVAAAALLAFVVMAWATITGTSPCTDETTHLASGYSYLTRHDYRLNPEHPPLLKKLAALPLLGMTVDTTGDALQRQWERAASAPMAQWEYAHALFYSPRAGDDVPSTARLAPSDFRNDAEGMFRRGRTMMLLLGVLLGVAIFCWSAELWGAWGGAVSVVLFAFDPNFIAHSGLVNTDVGMALFFFGACWCFWRLCREFSIANAIGFAAMFALAQIAKFSAALLAPIVVILAVWCVYRADDRKRVAVRMALVLGATALVTIGAIWAAYGFRSASASGGRVKFFVEEWYARESLAGQYPDVPPDEAIRRAKAITRVGTTGRMLLLADRMHLLPQTYLEGFAILRATAVVRPSFLNGQYSSRGFPDYFLWTFLYKTPLPGIVAIAASIVVAIRRRRASAFLLVPAAIYLAVSLNSNINIGHRHILPVYPFLYVLCGALASWVFASRVRAIVSAALVVIASLVVFSPAPLPMWGRHLSYMNELAGGPLKGSTKLTDSNLDWGQDLKRLAPFAAKEPINLLYFGTADPRYYGVPFRNMRLGYFAVPELPLDAVRRPGLFAISATHYRGVTYAADSRDYWREYVEKNGKYIGSAGYSIYVYRLD